MSALTFEPAARRASHFAAVERRLFEVLGGWVPGVEETAAKLILREQSFHHAWHAELWEGLLPAGREAWPNGGLRSGLQGFLDAVAEPSETLSRVVGAYRVVLPHLITAYTGVVEGAASTVDAPLLRAVTLMLADDLSDWRVGERLVQECLVAPGDAERAATQVARVEALLLADGGIGWIESS